MKIDLTSSYPTHLMLNEKLNKFSTSMFKWEGVPYPETLEIILQTKGFLTDEDIFKIFKED